MNSAVAIVAYRCEVDGRPTDSLDIQVRYFDSLSPSEVEQFLRSEALHSYTNDSGDFVTWPLARILSIQLLDKLSHSAEIAGFIAGAAEFGEWTKP